MRFVRDQHDARTLRDVRVVRDVEQDQSGQRAVADPLVEDRHEGLIAHLRLRAIHLHAHPLETVVAGHQLSPFSAAATAGAPPDWACRMRA